MDMPSKTTVLFLVTIQQHQTPPYNSTSTPNSYHLQTPVRLLHATQKALDFLLPRMDSPQ
jgi:hypothetical protein